MYAVKLATRTRICRLVFGLSCVLPTLCIAGAAVVRNSAPYQTALLRAWETQLEAQLGMDVRVKELEDALGPYPVLMGVELLDPESHECLARAQSVKVVIGPQGVAAIVGPAEVQQQRLQRLMTLLHEHVLVRARGQQPLVQWQAEQVTLTDGEHAESLLNVFGALDACPEGAEAFCEFRATTMPEDQCVRLRWVRNRQVSPHATGWEVHVPASGIPCALAWGWFPSLQALGTDCVFQGSAWSEQRGTSWETELSGQFRQVDLDQCVTRSYRHKLSGWATVTFNELRFRDDRVVTAEGRLHSEGGVVGKSLLEKAVQVWNLDCTPHQDDAQYLAYEQLTLDFTLQASGLTLGAPESAVMSDKVGPVVRLRDNQPRSATSLVQLLAPPSTLQVPATRETANLIRMLPLPEQAPTPVAEGYPVLRWSLR